MKTTPKLTRRNSSYHFEINGNAYTVDHSCPQWMVWRPATATSKAVLIAKAWTRTGAVQKALEALAS